MSSAITDPEVLDFIQRTNSFYPVDSVDNSVARQRDMYNRMAASFHRPRPATIATDQGAVSGPGGLIPIRRYWPRNPGNARVIYFHGGGFVVGGLESHDDVCAEISETCGLEVVSVDYRLCPEHPHPAAYEDALAAVDFFDDMPLVVAGDSAGGNLAAAVALTRGHKMLGQVLIYPGLGGDFLSLPSYAERANAPLLTAADIGYYRRVRTNGEEPKGRDTTLMPLLSQDFSTAPPCFAASAEHDPLRDDGPAWVEKLRAAGVEATSVIEPELPHGHLRARHSSARAKDAFRRVTDAISGFAARAQSG